MSYHARFLRLACNNHTPLGSFSKIEALLRKSDILLRFEDTQVTVTILIFGSYDTHCCKSRPNPLMESRLLL